MNLQQVAERTKASALRLGTAVLFSTTLNAYKLTAEEQQRITALVFEHLAATSQVLWNQALSTDNDFSDAYRRLLIELSRGFKSMAKAVLVVL